MNELALFAGAGGGILGGHLLGWRTVAAVEIEDYPRRVLLQRQADGILPRFPIWDDVCTFDGNPWRGRIDIITGGFPCQDISAAGKGAGLDGERSGLWKEMARIIGEVQPGYVLVENSPMLTSRGLGRVLGDMAEMGYDAEWGVLGADDAGAPHIRKRIWILANANQTGCQKQHVAPEPGGPGQHTGKAVAGWWDTDPADVPDSEQIGLSQSEFPTRYKERLFEGRGNTGSHERIIGESYDYRRTEPRLGRVAHGVAHRVDRLAAIGNGQVPAVVKLFWRIR